MRIDSLLNVLPVEAGDIRWIGGADMIGRGLERHFLRSKRNTFGDEGRRRKGGKEKTMRRLSTSAHDRLSPRPYPR